MLWLATVARLVQDGPELKKPNLELGLGEALIGLFALVIGAVLFIACPGVFFWYWLEDASLPAEWLALLLGIYLVVFGHAWWSSRRLMQRVTGEVEEKLRQMGVTPVA